MRFIGWVTGLFIVGLLASCGDGDSSPTVVVTPPVPTGPPPLDLLFTYSSEK